MSKEDNQPKYSVKEELEESSVDISIEKNNSYPSPSSLTSSLTSTTTSSSSSPFPLWAIETGLRMEKNLLDAVSHEEMRGSLLIWESQDRGLVVPKPMAHNPKFSQAKEALAALGYSLILRESGGGSVPLTPGCWNITLVFPLMSDPKNIIGLETLYERLCQPILTWVNGTYGIEATTGETPGAFCDGRYNININDQKIAGTAQKWRPIKKGVFAVLAHVALMVEMDIDKGVEAVNTFQQMCGLGKPSLVESHTTINDVLKREGIAPLVGKEAEASKMALYQAYSKVFAPFLT